MVCTIASIIMIVLSVMGFRLTNTPCISMHFATCLQVAWG